MNPPDPNDELVRLRPMAVSRRQRNAWLWALRQRPGLDLAGFVRAGGDGLLRQIAAEVAARGGKLRQDVAEYLDTHRDPGFKTPKIEPRDGPAVLPGFKTPKNKPPTGQSGVDNAP